MAYNAWSVVFGEQPTAAKWNQLGTNDAGFRDGTNIQDDAIDSRHITDGAIDFVHLGTDIAGFQLLADVTLGAGSDTLSSGTFTARKFLKFFAEMIPSGSVTTQLRLNNDSGNNYGFRYTIDNGVGSGSDATNNVGNFSGSGTQNHVVTGEIFNNATGRPKMGRATVLDNNGATRPNYVEFYFGWNNTSAQITRIDFINTNTGDIATGSRIVVMGRD